MSNLDQHVRDVRAKVLCAKCNVSRPCAGAVQIHQEVCAIPAQIAAMLAFKIICDCHNQEESQKKILMLTTEEMELRRQLRECQQAVHAALECYGQRGLPGTLPRP